MLPASATASHQTSGVSGLLQGAAAAAAAADLIAGGGVVVGEMFPARQEPDAMSSRFTHLRRCCMHRLPSQEQPLLFTAKAPPFPTAKALLLVAAAHRERRRRLYTMQLEVTGAALRLVLRLPLDGNPPDTWTDMHETTPPHTPRPRHCPPFFQGRPVARTELDRGALAFTCHSCYPNAANISSAHTPFLLPKCRRPPRCFIFHPPKSLCMAELRELPIHSAIPFRPLPAARNDASHRAAGEGRLYKRSLPTPPLLLTLPPPPTPSLLQLFVHGVNGCLEPALQLRPLELECGCEQVVLHTELATLQVHRLDDLKALKLLCAPGCHELLEHVRAHARIAHKLGQATRDASRGSPRGEARLGRHDDSDKARLEAGAIDPDLGAVHVVVWGGWKGR
eukprot:364665-Chlamydomonas_euryale.AAC.3